MILFNLFFCFIKVGLFSIGGGYAALPLIQDQVVDINNWLNMQEFSDITVISQMTPGPIAINCATFVGTKIAGVVGSIVATVGLILPSIVIVGVITIFYYKYKNLNVVKTCFSFIKPATIALIAYAGLLIIINVLFDSNDFNLQKLDYVALCLFFISFLILRKFKLNPIVIMLASALVGVIVYNISG